MRTCKSLWVDLEDATFGISPLWVHTRLLRPTFAQLANANDSTLKKAVWSTWTPPKQKFFAWLILRWLSIAKEGPPNCGLCQFCKKELETALHLLLKCRFSGRVWEDIKACLRLFDTEIKHWQNFNWVLEWRSSLAPWSYSQISLACFVGALEWTEWTVLQECIFYA